MAKKTEWARAGRNAVTLRFPARTAEERAHYARALRQTLRVDPSADVRDWAISFDRALLTLAPKLSASVEDWAPRFVKRLTEAADPHPRVHRKRVTVTYDGRDLKRVAEAVEATVDEVAATHMRATYTVQAMGGPPGLAVLDGLHASLRLPLNPNPRGVIRAGSVALAEDRCVIALQDQPGGWHIVAQTCEPVFDPERDPPFLIAPGDRVRLTRRREPVPAEESS